MQCSSPLGYHRRACSPRKQGDSGPFSKGYRSSSNKKGQSAPREPFSIPKRRLAICGWLTYGKPCKALYTQKVDFAQVKTELQLMEKNDLEVLRAENDQLMVELEKLKAEKKSHGRRRVYN
jgi:hypothetical protein